MDRMRDPNTDMDRDDRTRTSPEDDSDAAERTDWDRSQYVGEGQGGSPSTSERDDATHRTWKSEEWVGEGQDGGGMPGDKTAEGDSGLSGHGHPSGESHWGQGEATKPRDR